MSFKSKVGDSFTYLTEIKDLTIISKPDYFYLNSTIYPIEIIDKLKTEITAIDGRSNSSSDLGVYKFNQDSFNSSITGVIGTLKVALKLYLYNKTEEDVDKITSSITNISGILREVLLKYNIKEDNLLSSIKGISGILRTVLITYNFYKTENIQNSISNVTSVLDQLNQSYEMFIKGNNEVYKYPSVMNRTMFRSVYNTLYQSGGTEPTEEDLSLIQLTFNEKLQVIDAHNVVLMFGKVIGQTEPTVIVNEYTTSALNFETDLIDKIDTTVWNKEGTADITSVNKIFGNNSFETKALGDSLYTNSNVINGGATPFTVEFYVLVIPSNTQPSSNYYPIFTDNYLAEGSQQGLFLHKTYKQLMYQRTSNIEANFGISGNVNFYNNKIFENEINKLTITYDGVALRFFINNKLDFVIGTLNGHYIKNTFTFLRNVSALNNTTKGLLDNINIFDGEARVVRDYDEHADKLIVDLAFDGENNSTKIVDNGTEKLAWVTNGNAKISTDQKFDGFSSLYCFNSSSGNDYCITNNNIVLKNIDFTISFEFLLDRFVSEYSSVLIASNLSNGASGSCIAVSGVSENRILKINLNALNYEPNNLLTSTSSIELNKKYKVHVVVKNSICYLYLDGILNNSKVINTSIIEFTLGDGLLLGRGGTISNANPPIIAWTSSMSGYIKNFKIYKGVALIPESPVGKIQLDFNNVIDKYNNSTWTNNGVTFDQINSVKGYSSKYENGNFISSNNTNSLNFGTDNFLLSFDSKKNNLNYTAYLFSNNILHSDVSNKAIWFYKGSSTNNFSYIDYKDKPSDTTSNINTDYPNVWYSECLGRTSSVLYQVKNDVIVLAHNLSNQTFDFRYGNAFILGKAQWINGADGSFNGYIDNFKSIKDYQEPVVIDKPAVHLPLETNVINIGFTPLIINSVGNPTYTIIDGKKCIKFESGKYLNINSNNIFNLGTSSDFYIEFDYKPIIDKYHYVISNGENSTTNLTGISFAKSSEPIVGNIVYIYLNGIYLGSTTNKYNLNEFNNVKFYRINQSLILELNGVKTFLDNGNISLNNLNTIIGNTLFNSTSFANGYMSNFKMFVGTSTIPESYNDKKVLNLDFKPTRKSYLFKDNNNKCVIHPVNITQRAYQDSEYCCTFNGTDQYLQLGKNDLFNFGYDDFVINFKVKITEYLNVWQMILGNNVNTNVSVNGYAYIAIQPNNTSNPSAMRVTGCYNTSNWYVIDANVKTPLNEIVDVKVIYKDKQIKLYINDVDVTIVGYSSTTTTSYGFNFNENDNTYIGYNADGHKFKGTIYSLKVLRNTTDLTLLENEEVDPSLPLQVTISNPPVQINPINGTVIQVTGTIKNSIQIPVLTATLDGDPVSESDIFISENSDASYTYLIRLFTDNLDGKHTLEVSVQDDAIVEYVTTTIEVVRDIILKTNLVDSFGTSWYNCNPNKQVTIRKFEDEPMLYFDGDTALYSTNNAYKLGLAPFTIELDIIVMNTGNNIHLLSYGRSSSNAGWYSLERNSNGSLRFTIDKNVNNYLETSINLININTKYRISVTRDAAFNLRIFVDGLKVAEKVDKTVIDSAPNSDSNILYLGRSGILYNDNANKHFKGYIGNFYLNRSECKYTSDYTIEDYIIGLDSKSLLTFTSEDVGFSTKVDSFESDITWTNTGCTVVDNKLLFNGNTTRLLSSEYDTFILNNNNWTIDLIFKCNQISTGTTLLDLRLNNNSFNGVLITQPAADPTSILVSIGDSTATQSYSYTLTTGINSLNITKEYRLKLVRSANELLLFLDGVLKQKVIINLVSITTPNKLCLGNNLGYTTGFNGYIKQFRLLNGTASDVYAFPVIEGETLE